MNLTMPEPTFPPFWNLTDDMFNMTQDEYFFNMTDDNFTFPTLPPGYLFDEDGAGRRYVYSF